MKNKSTQVQDDSDQIHICNDTQSYFEQVYFGHDFSSQESDIQEYWPDEDQDYLDCFLNIDDDDDDLSDFDYVECMIFAEETYREQADVDKDCVEQDYGAGFSGGYNGLLGELKVRNPIY